LRHIDFLHKKPDTPGRETKQQVFVGVRSLAHHAGNARFPQARVAQSFLFRVYDDVDVWSGPASREMQER